MIRVLLADDEAIEREGLKMMLTKNRPNIEIVAEARNGREAVELALSHQPDLIFMDIKMPELDGLAAIEKIRERLPDTKCIMVSAYDTFQYAKTAMKFGIKEYLLKPSKVSEVLEAYDHMAEEIETEQQAAIEEEQLSHRLERASSLVEIEFILSLMMDHVHAFHTEDWEEWLDLEQTKGFAAVFFFKAEKPALGRKQKESWYQILKEALDRQSFESFAGPLTGYQIPVLIKCEEDWDRGQIARDIIHSVQHSLDDCQLYVGIGSFFSKFEQFSVSYEEAVYALESLQHNETAKYSVYSKRLQKRREDLIPFEEEKHLMETIKKGEVEAGLLAFEAYYKRVQKNTGYNMKQIKKVMESFFIVLSRVTRELGFKQDVVLSLKPFDSAMQMKEAIKPHLVQVMEEIGKWRNEGIEGLLVQTKEYIETNYEQNITLESAAERVGLSSYYLSKLFKEHFHISFIEYVTRTRLDRAKELLLNKRLSLKEIALSVGYKDPNYFSRVFKKEMEISPSDYRKQWQ